MAVGRILEYRSDWGQNVNPNFIGWYPEARVSYPEDSSALQVRAEPLYLQVYEPVDFPRLAISGSVRTSGENINLGLRQQDGSWQWQVVSAENFNLTFDLSQASRQRNKLEFILSVPDLQATSTLWLADDWQFIFSR